MKNTLKIVLLLLCLLPPRLWADEDVAVTVHVHSTDSSGARSILEISQLARKGGVGAVIMTDLLCERYVYGLPPFEKFIKSTIRRNSIYEKGVPSYLHEIKQANEMFPDVIMIDGTAATPFYYWSGNVWPGPLVLHERGRDMLVLGLGEASAYENLPVLSNGKSRFDAFHGDQHTRPYQDVIDYVNSKGGLIFWSHPGAWEMTGYTLYGKMKIELETHPHTRHMLESRGHNGVGVSLVDMSMIGNPEYESAVFPGGDWDAQLMQAASGSRKQPVWAIGELDYNGIKGGIDDIGSLVNVVHVKSKTRENILQAIRDGQYYLAMRGRGIPRRLVLEEFDVSIRGGSPKIRVRLSFSDGSSGTVNLMLVRDGKMIQQWEQQVPSEMEQPDLPLEPGEKTYYRIIAFSDQTENLLSQPVFIRSE